MLRAVDAQHDARDVGALGRRDRERLDVEAAPREHVRDARERARLVLDEHRDRVLHGCSSTASASPSEYSIASSAAAPDGIIGKQCSRGSTRTSTTVVRPDDSAVASASSSWPSSSTVSPSAPYASASAA